MEDDEEIDSSLHPFDGPFGIEPQLHEKSKRCKLSSKGKKQGTKNPKSAQNTPPSKIAKEVLNVRKSLGVSVISDETSVIRRITRSRGPVQPVRSETPLSPSLSAFSRSPAVEHPRAALPSGHSSAHYLYLSLSLYLYHSTPVCCLALSSLPLLGIRTNSRGKMVLLKRYVLKLFMSLKYITANVVGGNNGKIVATASTVEHAVKNSLKCGRSCNAKAAAVVGVVLARQLKVKGLEDGQG
ncbi:hypothetical protein Cgig2_027263 [Carnegiea gigantea]|uniref:Uncharacterized protein n=1 Tax=Carnegiea gigantea TaxID=171969 RepID=A0A9Q1GJ27_9CARY|nr:hypothetical protein Cgig2_027263 [Carnegiea gigantea]